MIEYDEQIVSETNQVKFFNDTFGSTELTTQYDKGRDQFDDQVFGLIKDYCKGEILEIGCGNCRFLRHLLSKIPGISVSGVDLSETGISVCKKTIPQGKFYSADFFDFISEKKYDVVLCFQTLEHIGDHIGFLKKMIDACRQGGMLIITVPNKYTDACNQHVHFWDTDEFNYLLGNYVDVVKTVLFNEDQNIVSICKTK